MKTKKTMAVAQPQKNVRKFFDDFQAIQKSLKIVGRNAKGYNYKYTDLPSLWEEIREIITENNFIIFNEIKAKGVKTTALHSSGEKLTSFIPFTGVLKPQDKGSEISYYRRYNIQAIFNVISGDEDDDGAVAQKSAERIKEIEKILDKCTTLDRLKKEWGLLSKEEKANQKIIKMFNVIKTNIENENSQNGAKK